MRRLSLSSLEPSPRNLLLLLSVVTLSSMVVILSLASVGIYHVYSARVIASAEEDAENMGLALLEIESESFLRSGPEKIEVRIEKEQLAYVDSRWRQLLSPFEIVKIKIYDDLGRIVYSTDPSIIGKVDDRNERLARALAGHNDSHLERKDQLLDLKQEMKMDVDVVETYVPIRLEGGAVIGAFEIYRDVTRYQNEVIGGLFSTLGILALILLVVFSGSFIVMKIGTDQLARAQSTMKEMAIRDPLTGVLNRREILKRAHAEISRVRREQEYAPGATLGVLMVDIDFFKRINDTFGHFAGDQVLRDISARIMGTIRQYDIVGRYGGEEFLVILPGTSLESSIRAAEKIRLTIANKPFDMEGEKRPVTVSIGVAVAGPREGEIDDALRRADEGLYRAKNGGRDRVRWVDTRPGPVSVEVAV